MTDLPSLPTPVMVSAVVRRATTILNGRGTLDDAQRTKRAQAYAFLILADVWPTELHALAKSLGASRSGSLAKLGPDAPKPNWWHQPYADSVRKALDATIGRWRVAQARREAERATERERQAERAEARREEATRRAAEAAAVEREARQQAVRAELKRQAEQAQRAHRAMQARAADRPQLAEVRDVPPVPRVYTRMPQPAAPRPALVTAKPRDDWWSPAEVRRRGPGVSVTADLCGDPAPGRSALDQRRAGQ